MSFSGASIQVVENNLERIADRLEPAVQDGLVLAGAGTLKRSRPLTPYRTGHLRNTAQLDVQRLVVIVFWMAAYAAYQEFGTRRGIKPKLYATTSAEAEMQSLLAYLEALEALL